MDYHRQVAKGAARHLLLACCFATLAACGSDDDSPCRRVANAVCTRSCECTTSGETCRVTDPRGVVAVTRTFENFAACVSTSEDYCESNDIQEAACVPDIEAAGCSDSDPEGSVVLPLSCLE